VRSERTIATSGSTEKHRRPCEAHGGTVDELGDASKAVDHAADDMKPSDVRTIMPDVPRKLSDQHTIEADEDLRGALVEM
jgi:hypothetical protein